VTRNWCSASVWVCIRTPGDPCRRLTLNVVLSFAQFEREVTAERIRDKFRASKEKGMWMGRRPPLGYDIKNRHLIINAEEVGSVNTFLNDIWHWDRC